MLPSMPVLFSRESQEAFGNKIQPSTSFFSQNSIPNFVIKPEILPEVLEEVPKQEEPKNKKEPERKKKNDPPNVEEKDLENAFIRSYYQKVQSRFSFNSSVPMNKFVQFQNILRNFDPNVETPVDLYKKIEELFGVEHKDIVEDFLLFLKPGQAAEVGRFMDRFMLVQMTSFINLLHNTFGRKPTVLRKVVRALAAGAEGGDSAAMQSRVAPHFRSHPRLTQMFKSLFPDERPSDSVYETGVDMINESFLTNDKGYDVWEFEEETDKKGKLEAKEELDSMYLNGRVFLQHGRLLRSARVCFPYSKEPYRAHARRLAPAHCHLTPTDSDEEPGRDTAENELPKRTRKRAKSPTKKDVNDNTKKDRHLLGPKPRKSQPKTKNGKKEECKDVPKRERKDGRNQVPVKREVEASKSKQAKIDSLINATIKIEPSIKAEVKIEPLVEPKTEPKIEPAEILEPKIEASVSVEANAIEVKSNNWTRDEDKTMLQVLKGEAGSEKVFGRIRELLPHRSATEIKERFCHVMTLLQQMAVGEVT